MTISTLSDWERLWTHLSLDTSDEICRNVTLFRACIRFFMHEKTLKLIWALFVYNQIVSTMYVALMSPRPDGIVAINCQIAVYNFITSILYTLFYRLYNGHPTRSPILANAQEDLNRRQENTRNIMASGHWFSAFKWMVCEAISECRSLAVCRSQSHTYESISQHTVSSFDKLLNIALKFLVRHCKVDIQQVNLSKRGYKLAFLTIFTVVPIFCVMNVVNQVRGVKITCDIVGESSNFCQVNIIYTVLTFGSLTNQIYTFLFNGTMIISLISLTYGSELAFHMIGAWLQRYSSLRRVTFQSRQVSRRQPHGSRCSDGTDAEAEAEGKVEAAGQSEDKEMEDLMTEYLARDATEQYLFMVEYLRQCGSLWSFNILLMYIDAIYLLFFLMYNILSVPPGAYLDISLILGLAVYFFQVFIFLVFPTLSLAHVNSYINHLLDLFKNSSEDDFQLIGIYSYVALCLFLSATYNYWLLAYKNRWEREVGRVCVRGPSRVDSFWRLDHLQSYHRCDIHCDHSRWYYSLHIHHYRLESSVR